MTICTLTLTLVYGRCRASGIFPKFVQFLTAKQEEEAEKQKVLETELDELNKFLEGNGPYLGGDKFIAADAALSPKLHHIDVAAKALKVGSLPSKRQCKHADQLIQHQHPCKGSQLVVSLAMHV